MSNLKNINFENFIPNDKFKASKSSNKKTFYNLLKKINKKIKEKNNIFNSFSHDFKLNFNFKEIKKFKKFKRIITIGFGGSILGAQAINSFLKRKTSKELIFINNLDFDQIKKLNKINNLRNSLFVIISKSGNTIEILSIIDSLRKSANFNKNNSVVITDDKNSYLNSFAKKLKIKIFTHRKFIGGRYSVFTETALIPCYLMGVNIFKFKKNILNFLNKKKYTLIENLTNLSKIYDSKKINSIVLLNYCNNLEYFLLWCQQLIAESLGKKGKGIIPLISLAPRDNHSLLQLYLDGPRDNFFYIFSSKERKKTKKNKGLFVEALNNKKMDEILENQRNATISLFKNKKIPFLSIEINKRDEETLGELFSYFILETVLIAEKLRINPYDQPAVEQLKKISKKILFTKIQK